MLAVDKFVGLDYGSVFDSGLRATSPRKANVSMSGPGVNQDSGAQVILAILSEVF